MTHRRQLEAAAAAAALFVGLAGCQGNRSEDPPVHLQQNMDFQDRGDPQEHNDFFADGRWMRTPPAGTVAVGHLDDDDHRFRGLALDGTVADGLPEGMELDAALLERGEERYAIFCAPCHGATGHGDGPAARRAGGMTVAPVNLHMQKLYPAPLGYFYRVMTFGKGQMLPYASQVPVDDRWAIAAFVRALQVSHQAGGDAPGGADRRGQ